ncbi:MAG TPA: aldo/keto reductase [Candidatus Hydrogenedentes bacterium]|nr:aldo/keto reductase [Candidatus Hydrogenedentota bacterium]HOL75783.1 aldo/keto reductase [Candidatus Hydrogenedentota bacterium]HPO84223.1 aldo/keto reductase [Candidatus Hydrogenedentota bacterium]
MEYRFFGKTGVRISQITLGTMTFGREADEKQSRQIMSKALDIGINSFDTANIYNRGVSEEIVGRFLASCRDDIFLATKVHFPVSEKPNDRGSSKLHILRSVEGSLKRLHTDRIDLLYLHHWDDNAALEESLSALDILVTQGKILYGGVSNFSAWQVMKALWVCDVKGFYPIVAIQPMYNLLKRQAEVEILPMAHAENLAVLVYSPQAGGLLTGKYLRGAQGRLDNNEMYKKRYSDPTYEGTVKKFVSYAEESGKLPGALAIAWTISHPAVTSAIVGASTTEQFAESLTCLDYRLSDEERTKISSLSPEPPLATDREKT